MQERIILIRESIAKIAQMLSGKSIQVTQRGTRAYVTSDKLGCPVRVNLPYIPENAEEGLINAIQGFLDHEVAHILFSDFIVLGKGVKQGVGGMHNILEDSMIERHMAKKFNGSAHNLGVTGRFFLDSYTTPELKKALDEGDMKRVVGILMVPAIRAWAGQFVFQEYMKDKWAYLETQVKQFGDITKMIAKCETTKDTLEVALKLREAMKEPKKPEEKKEEGGEGEGKAPPSKSGKKSDEEPEDKGDKPDEPGEDPAPPSDHDGDAEDKEKPEEAEGDKSDEESEANEEDDENEESGEGESGAEIGTGKAEDEEGEGYSEPDSDDGESDSGDIDAEADATSGHGGESTSFDEMTEKLSDDFEKAISEKISEEAVEAAKSAPYLIYTNELDKVETLPVGGRYSDGMLEFLEDSTGHMTGPLQKDLERAIAARSLSTWQPGMRRGKIHAANLSRLATGDDRVFRKRQVSDSKDVAVELVIDCSGSMSGAKIQMATQAAYALSSVLDRIGIANEVIGFTTVYSSHAGRSHGEIAEEERKMGRTFTRSEAIYMPILKGFTERMTPDVKKRFAFLPSGVTLNNNIDGESIQIAATRLMRRKEVGKVMIVLSDGQPAAHGDYEALCTHLHDTVKSIEKRGVNVIGLGIMDESVRKYYSKYIVVNDIADLPGTVMAQLKKLLIG